METISLKSRLTEITRKRDNVRNLWVFEMEAGVETSHLWNTGHSVENGFDGCDVVWLMERRQRYQRVKVCHDFCRYNRGLGIVRSPMNDAMANCEHPRTRVCRAEPGPQRINRGTTITDFPAQLIVRY